MKGTKCVFSVQREKLIIDTAWRWASSADMRQVDSDFIYTRESSRSPNHSLKRPQVQVVFQLPDAVATLASNSTWQQATDVENVDTSQSLNVAAKAVGLLNREEESWG